MRYNNISPSKKELQKIRKTLENLGIEREMIETVIAVTEEDEVFPITEIIIIIMTTNLKVPIQGSTVRMIIEDVEEAVVEMAEEVMTAITAIAEEEEESPIVIHALCMVVPILGVIVIRINMEIISALQICKLHQQRRKRRLIMLICLRHLR